MASVNSSRTPPPRRGTGAERLFSEEPQPSLPEDPKPSSVVGLFEEQLDLYQRLRDLGTEQGRQIHGGSVQTLLGVLSERQKLIDQLTQIEQQLAPIRKQWDQLRATLSDADRARIRDLVRQIEDILSAIIKQDEQDRQELSQARSQIGEELGRLSHTSTALQAYQTRPATDNRFTNRQG